MQALITDNSGRFLLLEPCGFSKREVSWLNKMIPKIPPNLTAACCAPIQEFVDFVSQWPCAFDRDIFETAHVVALPRRFARNSSHATLDQSEFYRDLKNASKALELLKPVKLALTTLNWDVSLTHKLPVYLKKWNTIKNIVTIEPLIAENRLGRLDAYAIFFPKEGGYCEVTSRYGVNAPLSRARLFETKDAAYTYALRHANKTPDNILIVKVALHAVEVAIEASDNSRGALQSALCNAQKSQLEEALRANNIANLKASLAALERDLPNRKTSSKFKRSSL